MNRQNIKRVYKRDIKNTLKNPIALIIIFAICVIPALYAWINIVACWDVYENTGGLPVAVINNDEDVLFDDEIINIGDDVVEELRENDKIKWTFVSRDQADKGLKEGTYYASIEIPESFSDDFMSVLEEDPHKPHIIYKVDTKSNPVAVKITDTAKNTLVEQIKSNFVATVNETVFKSLNDIGEDADTKKEDLIRMKDFIVSVNRNIDFLDNALENVTTGSVNYKSFMEEIHALSPEVERSIETLEKNTQNRAELLLNTEIIINGALDGLENNFYQATESSENIHKLINDLNDTHEEMTENDINKTVLKINYQINALDASIEATRDYLEVVEDVELDDEIDSAQERMTGFQGRIGRFEDQLVNMQDALSGVSGSMGSVSDALENQIDDLKDSTQAIDEGLDSAIDQLKALNSGLGSPVIQGAINQLENIQDAAPLHNLGDALEGLKEGQDNIQDQVDTANARVGDAIEATQNIDDEIDNVLVFSEDSKEVNENRDERLEDVSGELESIQKSLRDQKEQIAQIEEHLEDTNEILSDRLNTLSDTVATTSSQLKNIETRFIAYTRKDINEIIDHSIDRAKNTSVLLESLKSLNDYIKSSSSASSQGGQLTADFAAELKRMLNDARHTLDVVGDELEMIDNRDISLIISLLQSNPEFMGDFMSSPFDLQTETINAIPNYGSSMAPVYSTLALWVGCLFLNSVLKARPGQFDGANEMTVRERHFGKMLYFWTLAIFQALIIAVGDIWLLKIHVVNAPLFILFAVLSSIVFSTITFTLMATLSNFGKALSIIYMILQLAGSGGTYPIQVDPLIFRILQPLFPFTYSINGFREAIAGPLLINVFLNIIALIIFAIVFIIYGYMMVEKLHPKVEKFEQKLKESGLGE